MESVLAKRLSLGRLREREMKRLMKKVTEQGWQLLKRMERQRARLQQ